MSKELSFWPASWSYERDKNIPVTSSFPPPNAIQVTPTHHVSHEPKIGGSEAAFIVLVILLAVIIVASSAGIYFLLRNGEPSPANRAARRKYPPRRKGIRAHLLPIGLPGSLSEKFGSLFKGRRPGAGWVPARGEDDGAGERATTAVEPLRVRNPECHNDDDDNHRDGGNVTVAYEQQHQYHHGQQQLDGYPRVGSAPALRRATLTEVTLESAHRSRSASHVDAGAEIVAHFGREDCPSAPVPAPSFPTVAPDEEWLDARGPRSGVGDGSADRSNVSRIVEYLTPQPRRADSGHEVTLFAGIPPFQQDV
ncbi:hypothetical protein BC827DRAFT_1155555 [Russula dissimulans]|nr:hypothetical protein BC827DRAFT_1155555 [Russula dissimulans]